MLENLIEEETKTIIRIFYSLQKIFEEISSYSLIIHKISFSFMYKIGTSKHDMCKKSDKIPISFHHSIASVSNLGFPHRT